MTEWRVADTGVQVAPPGADVLERRLLAADKPGEHLWVITAGWACPDPERPYEQAVYLDAETLVAFGGPGCYKCERPYSRKLARMRCTGSMELQP